MRKTILSALAIILMALIWACSSKTTTPKAVSPVAVHDTSRPSVISTFPAYGDSGVALNTPIVVVFSEEMDPASLDYECFFISGGFRGTVAYDNKTAVFTPAKPLDSAAAYYAVVHREVSDTAGNQMKDHFHWWFFTVGYFDTAAPPDTTTPPDRIPMEIISVDPPNGAVGVPFNTPFTVTFSKNVDPRTVTDSSLFLSDSIPGKIAVSAKTTTLTPTAPLTGNRTYTVTITTAIADPAGNHLKNGYQWSITTEPVEIMPLAVGNQWVYHTVRSDTMGNVTRNTYDTVRVTGTEVIAEETWFIVNGEGNYNYINRSDGLWKACSKNVLYIKFPVRLGEYYTTGTSMDYCSPPGFSVVSTDTVITVPAGTFRCITYLWGDYGGYYNHVYHYAPNVGLIRYDGYARGTTHVGSNVLTQYELH